MEQNYEKNWIRPVALVCFFVSGACSLIYQVTWTRMLGLVFGNTIFATSTVLTAFMSGLALGSFLAGKYADSIKRSLRVYAILELGIGFYCLLIPVLIELTKGIYIPLQRSMQMSFYSFSLVRFILCFALLVIPTTLMGATTPFFSRAYIEQGQKFGHGIGRIYAINTFGAFAGVMLSGFLMLEKLGVLNTIFISVIGNVMVASICLIVDYRFIRPREEKDNKRKPRRKLQVVGLKPKPSHQGIFILLMISYGI
ncbi:hypothetical protein FJZ33_05915, partial [Candidatus Poribacteria bacterium]|nr:hypothetical protein [Candidatus Poribacteria bacterium]